MEQLPQISILPPTNLSDKKYFLTSFVTNYLQNVTSGVGYKRKQICRIARSTVNFAPHSQNGGTSRDCEDTRVLVQTSK